MVATVIPLRRTIRGVDSFEYAIPAELTDSIVRGTSVWIPLRNKTILGVVQTVQNIPPTEVMRPISDICATQPWIHNNRMLLLEWFATYYAVSLATALKVLQTPILKRPRTMELALLTNSESAPIQIATALKTRIQDASAYCEQLSDTAVLQYTYRDDCIALYTVLTKRIKGNILLIVPEYSDVAGLSVIAHQSNNRTVVTIPQNASPSYMHTLIELLQTSSDVVVIGTKKAVGMPTELFSFIICDQEQAPSHKQIDSNPRYHAPSVLEQAAKITNTPILLTSPSPSLRAWHSIDQHVVYTRPYKEHAIIVAQMEDEYKRGNYTWFSQALQDRIHTGGKHLLLLNRTGQFGVAQCEDCNQLLDPKANSCEHCGSATIKRHRKGTETIENDIRELFPDKRVLRIDRTVESETLTQNHIADADIIIGTEKALRVCNLDAIDSITILSVDHLLVYPHYKSHERVHQFLSTIVATGLPVLLQTHAPEHPVIQSVTSQRFEQYATAELSTRSFLKLPPYVDKIQFIDSKTRKRTAVQQNADIQHLPPHIHIDRI